MLACINTNDVNNEALIWFKERAVNLVISLLYYYMSAHYLTGSHNGELIAQLYHACRFLFWGTPTDLNVVIMEHQ